MRKTPWKLLAPFILFELCFILAPLCSVIWQSFHPVSPDYEILPQWTLANYRKALDPANLPILGRTFLYAGSASFLALVLGYPVAYFIALKAGRRKNLFLILLMLPFWTSYLIRTYAWMTILQTDGLLNYLLLSVGIVSEPLQLLNTPGAVILGLTYGFIPFATLPIFVSLEQMDKRLIDAARDLGANDFQIFKEVIWPLSLPGVLAGALLSFVPALGDFVAAELLGGPDDQMIGNLIQQQYLGSFNWPFGSALSLLLIVLMTAGVIAYARVESGEDER
jgi:spermidine/putrescine transport system permease protein